MTDQEFFAYTQERGRLLNEATRANKYNMRDAEEPADLLLRDAIQHFGKDMYNKALLARDKYGFHPMGWAYPDWQEELQRQMAEHVLKGDPRDTGWISNMAWYHGWPTAAPAASSPIVVDAQPAFQPRVAVWMQETFGPEVSADFTERGFRFGEEAIELLQANGTTKEDVLKLVDYVYGRPIGELRQEVGGTMVTLAALCQAREIDLMAEANTEQSRVESPEIRAKIQAKQADKRARMIATPLPGCAPTA